jgi:hypothetical protein
MTSVWEENLALLKVTTLTTPIACAFDRYWVVSFVMCYLCHCHTRDTGFFYLRVWTKAKFRA